MPAKKILVTGKNGQLGQELQVLARSNNDFDFVFTDRTSLDIANATAVDVFFAENKFDYCINTAAYTAVDKAELDRDAAMLNNATAVGNLARNCAAHKVCFIHVSTDYVYNGTATQPYKEDHPTDPVNFYGLSKLVGEELALQYQPDAIVIRTSWVYSRFGHNFVKTMLRLTAEKETLNVVSDQLGSPTYAADLAEAILSIINQQMLSQTANGGIYHFSNDGIISWFDFATQINQLAGHRCKVSAIPSSEFVTPAKRPAYSAMDKSKIERVFGIKLKDWKESLAECIALLK